MARWTPQLLTASKDQRQDQGTEEPTLALLKVKGVFPRSAQQTSHMTISLILDQPKANGCGIALLTALGQSWDTAHGKGIRIS